MTKLQIFAQQLADLYKVRKNLQINLDRLQALIEARQLILTPAAGWLADQAKSNEQQRTIAAEKCFAADPDLIVMRAELSAMRDDLSGFEADIEGLQALASAERWTVREKLADALASIGGIEKTEDAAPEAPEFDDALQGANDAQTTATAASALLSPEPEGLPWS